MDLWYGFGIALQPTNLMWCVFGVLLGNLIGVLPGMGAPTAISMLLPLTYVMSPVTGILMLAGIFYGAQYGGAIGAILLNLPSHPPHAVTCLDGYPMTRMGRGGAALGVTMISSFFAASVGIIIMVFLSPVLVSLATSFGPAEIFSIMLMGLVAGATMSRGSPVKGIAMTLFGLAVGIVGTDITTATARLTLGMDHLADGVELGALCMGLFGIADFMLSVNRTTIKSSDAKVSMRDMRPTRDELKKSFFPMLRGTAVGTIFGALPGTGPTITTFISYAIERKWSKTPERFGKGAIEGVAAPEAANHAKTQIDFIPTMSLGIPGDIVMALILGALIIKGIQPGPQLISEHPDIFWGLVASFWIGNILLLILNVPLIGIWVKMLQVPYRILFPCAIFFICVGVFTARNSLFGVGEVAVFGLIGLLLMVLNFPLAPIILGYILGPMIEENFRRAMMLSHGDIGIFVNTPLSTGFLSACLLLVLIQVGSYMRTLLRSRAQAQATGVQA